MGNQIRGRSYIRIKNLRTNWNVIVDEGADDNTSNVWVRPSADVNDQHSWLFVFLAGDRASREPFSAGAQIGMRGVKRDPYLRHFRDAGPLVNAQRGPAEDASTFVLRPVDASTAMIDSGTPVRVQELSSKQWWREASGRLALIESEEDADTFAIELVAYDNDLSNLDKWPRDFCLQACGYRRNFHGTPREALKAANAFAEEVMNAGTYCPVGHATEGRCP